MMYTKNCLAQVICDCQRHGIKLADCKKLPAYMGSDSLKVGNFAFCADPHDTGITVNVILVHPDTGETYEIVRGTYWFSSRYEFNKFTWNKGKWDKALDDAINELRSLLAQTVAMLKTREKETVEAKAREEQTRKEKFEALYVEEGE